MATPPTLDSSTPALLARARRAAASLIAEHSLNTGALDANDLISICALGWLDGYGAGTISTMELVEATFKALGADLAHLSPGA